MDRFLKELTELCRKHDKYIKGCGCEDDMAMYINDDWLNSRFNLDETTKEFKKEE